ncbi:coth-domain-containing protein [Anaeromyces robustus]|uniref:Coth-domain-containing protein n=1 Tax=Anaeromyces robustus TaxID=1754192 RepID=A0A1Y1WP69_9FUNG|nr:coth-domain-containing protein [Anaeromyces robustus]|eukprot:ORX75339.1 coth-domain-containing protein [Anaeromyces robustus]
MLNIKLKLFFILLFFVYNVVSESSFIPKDQRAEIFKLTDNKVAVFRVTIPENEFASLKRKANFVTAYDINAKNDVIKKTVNLINSQNLEEIFPGNDFKKLLPDLPMNKDGYPTIDYTKYLLSDSKFEYIMTEYYVSFIVFKTFNDDSYLNLINVLYVLSGLEMSPDATVDENFLFIMNIFGKDKVTKDEEDGKYYLLDKDEDEDYYEFPFEYEYYDEYYGEEDYGDDNANLEKRRRRVRRQNIKRRGLGRREYEDYNADDFKKLLESYDFSKYDNPAEEEIDEFDFKTKNGTMEVEVNNKKSNFKKITFSLGGHFSRNFAKPAYNIKIRGGKELYGRRQFKLRSDPADPTYLRSKLVSDIHNRLGVPSISANYATLYINDEYMGLFVLTDAYKETWIEYVYGEKDTKLLYKCNISDLTYETRNGFKNENNEITDRKELYEFLAAMTTAQTPSEIEHIFDVDQFVTEIALEYLTSAWDHFMNQHNYYIYKNYKNNKWIYLAYDFDLDLGLNTYETDVTTTQSFDELSYPSLVEKLILNDFDKFNNTIKEIVTNAFNPGVLFPHIDELKAFIKPYVELDKTPDENGKSPGRINLNDDILFSMDQWDESSEFTDINSTISGLKLFILLKYRYICKEYGIQCDPKYLSDDYKTTTAATATKTTTVVPEPTEDVEPTITTTTKTTTTTTTTKTTTKTTTTTTTTTTKTTTTTTTTPEPTKTPEFKCMAEVIGYPCCTSKQTKVYRTDEYGDWSFNFLKLQWCGLTKYEPKTENDEDVCWARKLGYPCCEKCPLLTLYKDSNGSWGLEHLRWCGIIESQCSKN